MRDCHLGIHAPYTWDESTYLACQLGDFAIRHGVKVSYFPYQSREDKLHHGWDSKVLSLKNSDFEEWRQHQTHIVWFDVQKAKMLETRRSGINNILVSMWHRLSKDDLDILPKFNNVVCSCKHAFNLLSPHVNGALFPGKQILRRIPWDCGAAITDSPMLFGGKRLFIPVDGFTAREIGSLLFSTLRTLLDFDELLQITVGSTKNWSHSAMDSLGELIQRHPHRVKLLKKPTYSDRLHAYATHDWVFVPALRDNTGVMAMEALCARRPVIAFDVDPFRELVKSGHSGHLIPCEIDYDQCGAPCAVVNAHDMTEVLKACLSDTVIYDKLRNTAWPELRQRRAEFEKEWLQLLGAV